MFRLVLLFVFCLSACSTKGPDKTLAGSVLGAMWGAGTGAVIGNQLDGGQSGEGVAVGASLGLVSGALQGYAYDLTEDKIIIENRNLRELKVMNRLNGEQIAYLQKQMDEQAQEFIGVTRVFFDSDATNIKIGSVENLQAIADAVNFSTRNHEIKLVGHSDETGSVDYNYEIAKARVQTVRDFLVAKGVDPDSISETNRGAAEPLASNQHDAGRQLNRRVDVIVN